MAHQPSNPHKGNFPSSDEEWEAHARRQSRYFSFIKEFLNRMTGGVLNAGQLHTEGLGILVFLMKETLMFERMSEDEIRQTMTRFINEYLSLRDKDAHAGVDYFDVKSSEFKKCHLKLLKAVNNGINKRIEPEPFHHTLEKF